MCTCAVPRYVLSHLNEFGLNIQLPTEIIDIIVEHTRSYSHCVSCNRVLAKSTQSTCPVHTSAKLHCVFCLRRSSNDSN